MTTASFFDLPVVNYAKAKIAPSIKAVGISSILFVIAVLFSNVLQDKNSFLTRLKMQIGWSIK
ncbi:MULTISPECIES: hypothetical protein [Bacillaceae]|uniref:hypothetical protein n=1 Tax=Bacillaceae TaxID=186817 RepID=UPI000BFDE1F4|nr:MULTISPECIES: hypothetical protein [Bacillaceae]MCM3164340.1 hypothetical protein [Metabacillus litoralis]PGT85084.1 hypothetical protein COD11_09580 [Bacillus sp. AFS040349]UGB33718.1 hypothetical protein LPC09_26035 [Metabacillus sp. B2-18]